MMIRPLILPCASPTAFGMFPRTSTGGSTVNGPVSVSSELIRNRALGVIVIELTTAILVLLLLAATASAQQHPRDKDIHDADTRGWWHITESLANDGMEGRDTGSAAYQRAAELVADRFREAGLRPA